jgi:hypothetical protein
MMVRSYISDVKYCQERCVWVPRYIFIHLRKRGRNSDKIASVLWVFAKPYLAASKAARGATEQRMALLRRAEVGLAQVRTALAEKEEARAADMMVRCAICNKRDSVWGQ